MTTTQRTRLDQHSIVKVVFHPDGISFRGAYFVGTVQSICKHAHTTEGGALYCARRKRASWRRGEWS